MNLGGDLALAITVIIVLVYILWAVTTSKNDEARRLEDKIKTAKADGDDAKAKLKAAKDDKEAWDAYKAFKDEREIRSTSPNRNKN